MLERSMGTVQMVIITKHDSFFCELRVSTVQEKLITAALLISSLFCGEMEFWSSYLRQFCRCRPSSYFSCCDNLEGCSVPSLVLSDVFLMIIERLLT